MGVKNKAFPGGMLTGFAAEGKDSFAPIFPKSNLNQSLTKKYGNVRKKFKLKKHLEAKGEVYEREGT